MRPEAPPSYKPGMIERFGIQRALSAVYRSILRNLVRRPVQAVLAMLGISLATALLFTGFYFFDAIDRVIEVQFKKGIREDVILNFNTPLPGRVRYEIANLRGVNRSEFFRVVPVRLHYAHISKRVAVMGVEPSAELHRIVDKAGNVHTPVTAGLTLSTELARQLGVEVGDVLTVEVLEGSRPVRELTVRKTLDEMVGVNAYMDIASLNRLMGEDDSVSGAYLSIGEKDLGRLYPRLKSMPGIAGVSLPSMILRGFQDTFARTIGAFTFFLVLFSVAIVFGVVYNAARVALSERGRELASLRVLGFTASETSRILSGEQVLITLVAIPLGFLIGVLFCFGMNNLVDRELMRLPLVFSLRTPLLTATIVVIAMMLSNAIVSRRIKKLDLIEVLKTRE
jgi:putative ABC transport system permease protein